MRTTLTQEEKQSNGLIISVIDGISAFFSDIIKNYLPDPFLFAVILTVVTGLLGVILQDKTPMDMVAYWGQGFWGLLTFAMQMILMMIGGSVLAQAPLVQRLMDWIAGFPKTPRAAYALATFFEGIMAYLNWGLGLIAGTLMAKKLAERVPGVHYPLIIAASYTTFGFYMFGLSSSTPLLIATQGHFLEKQMGIIPLSQTIFHPLNILLCIFLLITLPLVNCMIKPRGEIVTYSPEVSGNSPDQQKNIAVNTPAERAEANPLYIMIAGIMGIAFMVYYFTVKKGNFDINMVNFILLFFSIILHGTTRNFINAVQTAGKGIGSMAIQFPFYAGIMGMMTSSGLVTTIAGWFVAISTPETLPFWGFVSSLVINVFVPSGGGHWVVQGPFMIEAAKTMGANLAATSMGVAFGNGVQDIIQPMWVLPALAISGLGIRDIMGYNIISFLWAFIVVSIGILVWGFISI
jgi:short-chain fatty acids transporter